MDQCRLSVGWSIEPPQGALELLLASPGSKSERPSPLERPADLIHLARSDLHLENFGSGIRFTLPRDEPQLPSSARAQLPDELLKPLPIYVGPQHQSKEFSFKFNPSPLMA
jgi:hypothetical protein